MSFTVWQIYQLIPLPFSDEDINSTTDRPSVFDPKHRGFVSFSGVATNVDEKTTEFDVKADQWVSAYKDVKDVRPVFPAHCTFPDSPRYRKGKPPVKNSRFVHVFGYLVGVQKDTAGMVTGFEISVDNVTFLGHHIPVAPAALQTDSSMFFCAKFISFCSSYAFTVASPSPVGKRKLKGSFSFGESPSTAAKHRKLGPSQAQNVSPSIAQSVSSKWGTVKFNMYI